MSEINFIHFLNHQVIRDLPFGVITIDKNFMIQDWNAWMERHTGKPRASVQGKKLLEIIPEVNLYHLTPFLEEVFRSGRTLHLPYDKYGTFAHIPVLPNQMSDATPHGEGGWIIQDVVLQPLLDTEGETAAIGIFIHDLTDHVNRMKHSEKLNRALEFVNKELQKANQVKSSFLQTISHELRTPLTSILGFLDLIDNNMAETPEERNEYFSNIRSNAVLLLNIINDILDAARLDAGNIELDFQAINLVEFLSEIHAIMHPSAKQKNLELILDIDDFELEVSGDYRRMKQVLLNVVGNAVKFTDKGSIRIVGQRIQEEQEWAEIRIIDTGIGLQEDQIPLVFKPFTQVESSAKRKYSGTGLGLSISKAYIELMKGTIHAESDGLGRGTCFIIRLPALTNH